ncbi:Calcium-activated BK potassium channel alpha subunit [Gracilaria domingensis]|nr:Calcium-activated BK potassium channel alpha subunit [Gracilaria domingensis]
MLKRILTIRSYTPNLPIYSMCALRDSMLQITFALEQVADHDEGEEVSSRRVSGMNLRLQMMDPSSSDMAGLSSSIGDELNPHMGDFEDEDDDDDGMLVASYDGSSDLKSEALCMQEIEMSLMAKNVFCNGLSTLLANLILRVTPMLKDEDPMWAWEYKLGTECRFEYVKLPMQLTNRRFSDIAVIMYDYGVIPVATKRFMGEKWRAVTPDTNINLNSIALIITFHSIEYLDTVMAAIANCATERFSDSASGSSELPFLDSEDPILRNNRCERAGAILTGDLTVQYVEDSENEYDQETQDFSSTQSGEGETPSSFRREETPEVFPPPTPGSLGTPLRTSHSGSFSPVEARSNARGPSSAPLRATNPEAHRVSDPIPVTMNALAQGKVVASGSIPEQMKSLDKIPLVITRTESTQHLSSMADGPENTDSISGELDHRRVSGHNGEQEDDSAVEQKQETSESSLPRMVASPSETAGSSEDHRKRRLADMNTPAQSSADSRSIHAIAGSSSDGRGLAGREKLAAEDVRRAPSRQKRHHVSFENQGVPRKSRKSQVAKQSRNQPTKAVTEGSVMMFHGDQELPMRLTGHIVVCTIGRMALQNLGYFLQQVNVERGFSKGKAPVVAICSRLSEEEEADLEVEKSESRSGVRIQQPSLVVIEGNSLSVKTLRRAQFEKAKAVVILACEDVNDIDHMDAKAIFTVMTLDYLLGEDSETFVCTMLDAEESMQLLRAPAHPRRRGAVLGRVPEENMELAVHVKCGESASKTVEEPLWKVQ